MDTPAAGASDLDAPPPPLHPGRNEINDRAISKVVEEASAEAIGVPRKEVSVTVSGSAGGMVVSIRSRIPAPSLDDPVAVRAAGPILDRVAQVQTHLRQRLGYLTGREVTRVNITVTGAVMGEERRVR